MKYKYLFIAYLWLSCCFSACIKDTGNYDYIALEEVKIEGLNDAYRFVLQKPQSIIPNITTRIEEKNLTYCWRIGADTICKTKEFNHSFTRIPLSASSNPLTFEILDNTTGVRYSKVMPVNIVSPFTTGWLMLTANTGNEAKLAFQSYEDEKMLYQDVYEEVNGEKLIGTPVLVKQLRYQDGLTGAYMDRVSVICQNGKSPELDGISFMRHKFYEDEFKSVTPHISDITSDLYRQHQALGIVSDGLIYGKVPGSMGSPDDAYYQYPYEGDEKGYRVNRYIATSGLYASYCFALDELNHRFVTYIAKSLSSKVSSVNWNEEESVAGVDLNYVPGEMVWMGVPFIYSNDIYSVILDEGKYILRVMTVGWDETVTLNNYIEIPDGVITANSCFALHPTSPYLFVSNGSSLKAINLEALSTGEEAVNEICTYEGEILAMHYAYERYTDIDEFGIAIQTGDNESALLIINPLLSSKGEILKKYEHVGGKVVSLYRKSM